MSTRPKQNKTVADGSAEADAPDPTRVDREKWPWRWVCPSCHGTNWDRTNNHIWCRNCSRRSEQGEDVEAEYYEILDKLTGRTVPWSAVRVVGDE